MDDKRDQYNEEESGRFGRRFTPSQGNGGYRPPDFGAPAHPQIPPQYAPQGNFGAGDPYRRQPVYRPTAAPQQVVATPVAGQGVPNAFGQQFVAPNAAYPMQGYPQGVNYGAPRAEEFDFDPDMQSGVAMPDTQRKKKGIFGWKGRREDDGVGNINNVVISYPRTYTDVQMIIDSLRNRQAIIVDLTRINDKSTQRILDFLSGAIYALCGSQQRIGDNMFLFTPDGVSIQGPTDLKKKYDNR